MTGSKRIYALDTNVLLHDPTSLFRFEEHDVFIPMTVLEELDDKKKGGSEVSRNGRQVSRFINKLIERAGGQGVSEETELTNPQGIKLKRAAVGRLSFQQRAGHVNGKADNQILAAAIDLRDQYPDRPVILVSKDNNLRIKASIYGITAEDYENDRALDDFALLFTGSDELPEDFWGRHPELRSWNERGRTFYEVNVRDDELWYANQCLYMPGENDIELRVLEITSDEDARKAKLVLLDDHTHAAHGVWGIAARNREQNFALNLLMDPDVDFVTLLGTAGTGKTLLALAAGLMLTLEFKVYSEIIMTRVTVPVGEDIGFLPGTEEEKMTPWMGALEDNLDVLMRTDDEAGDWGRAATADLIRNRIKVKSLNFMRGRTFINKYLIIDEAQNLTPKQMKTLITRAGPGTKVVCLGNIAQIDTPYLTEGSSGLTYVVDRFKGWTHSGHVTLQRGERSRLADHAAEIL